MSAEEVRTARGEAIEVEGEQDKGGASNDLPIVRREVHSNGNGNAVISTEIPLGSMTSAMVKELLRRRDRIDEAIELLKNVK